jgi:glucose/mannose transport system permease protein
LKGDVNHAPSLTFFGFFASYLLVVTRLKPITEIDLKILWTLSTAGIHFDNFIAGYKQLAPNLANSLMMVIPEAFLSALLGSLNGFLLF